MADSNELIFEIKFDIQKMQEEIAGIKANLDSVGTSGSNAFKALDKEIESVKNAMSATSTELENKDKELERLQKRLEELQSAFAAGDFDAGSVLYIDMKKTEDAIKNLIESEIQLSGQYDEQYDKLKELNAQRDKMASGSADETLKAKLRETTIELGNLLMKYREMSAAEQASAEGQALKMKIDELTQKAGALRDTMDDVNSTIKNTASDTGNLDAAVGGINLMAASFGAVQGSMALFGEDSEELAVVMTKLQGVLALTNSLTVIQNQLQKESALRMKLSTLWTKMKTAAMKQSATATAKETAAMKQNATATAKGATATATFTAAEGAATTGAITLKGAVKAVGTAIKSVPVIGWILAAISAITTLIGLISDANEEEEKGLDLRKEEEETIKRINREQQELIDNIYKEGQQRLKNIRALKNQTDANIEYVDTYEDLARATGMSIDYLKELDNLKLQDISNTYNLLEQQQQGLENWQELLKAEGEAGNNARQHEEDMKKAFQPTYAETYQKAIDKTRQKIKEYRQEELTWKKDQEANAEAERERQEAIKNAIAKKNEEERKYQELVKNNLAELKELHDAIYTPDEEEQITDRYDRLLDLAIKYYGEESEQVKKVTELRVKALDELYKKRELAANEETERYQKFFETSLKNKESETAKYLADRVKQITDQLNEAKDKEIAALDATYKEIDDKWVELLTYDYKKQHPLAVQSEIDKYISEQREKQGRFTKEEMHEKISNNKEVETANKIKEETAKIYDEQLNKYKSYADKYVQLTKEKNDKIAKLEKNGVKQSVIDAINEDYDKQVNALNEQFDEEQIAELVDNLDSLLGTSLENMISLANDLGELLKVAIKKGDVERAMSLETALNAVNEEIENILKNPEEDTSIIDKILGKDPQEFINNVKDAYDAITSLVSAMGDLNDVEAINMETGSKILGNMASVVANIASENYVGAAVSAISIITDTLEGNTRAAKAKFQSTLDGWEHYADVNIKKIKRHIDQLNESRDNVVGIEQYIKSRVIVTDYQKEIKVLERQKEELVKLLEQSNLTDEQRKQVEEQIADIDDQIYETEKAITSEKEKQMEQLTGFSTSADAVTAFGDAIISAWENGTSAANAAVGTWEDMIKQFAKQKFLSDFMSKQFEDIFNEYYDLIDGGNMISEEQQVNFRNQITELAENGKEFYNSLMESMGIANDIALEGTKGSGIAKASQESIDELNGRFLSVQMFTASISGSVERLYQNSTSIMRDVSDIRGFQENISGKIDAMNGYMQDIVNNGIRMN